MKTVHLPTAVAASVAYSGLIGTTLAFVLIGLFLPTPLVSLALLLLASAIPMWCIELYRNKSAFKEDAQIRVASPGKLTGIRIWGFLGAILIFSASIKLQLQLSPEWTVGLSELIFPAAICAFFWTIWYLLRPAHNNTLGPFESLGLVMQRSARGARPNRADKQTILGWLVKALFLPLMLGWTYTWLSSAPVISTENLDFLQIYLFIMAWMYAIDTSFATIGYLSTSSSIDAHIRSVDDTWLGWISALVCYPPLSLVVLREWLEYKDGLQWDVWLHDSPVIAVLWGGTILLLTAIYVWATVVFGPRFSNLTNRGIITSGPYRLGKHPAYFCKNASWWLISIPFISQTSTSTAMINCAALLGVNAIYWLRAKTEERHLMQDLAYREYSEWIVKYGLKARIARLFEHTSK